MVDNDTLWAIQWSKKLDDIFISNYQQDPTLSWQFFGSSTGFMRQFPGISFKVFAEFKITIIFHSFQVGTTLR